MKLMLDENTVRNIAIRAIFLELQKDCFFFRKVLPRKILMSIVKLNIFQKINYALVPDLYDVFQQ